MEENEQPELPPVELTAEDKEKIWRADAEELIGDILAKRDALSDERFSEWFSKAIYRRLANLLPSNDRAVEPVDQFMNDMDAAFDHVDTHAALVAAYMLHGKLGRKEMERRVAPATSQGTLSDEEIERRIASHEHMEIPSMAQVMFKDARVIWCDIAEKCTCCRGKDPE